MGCRGRVPPALEDIFGVTNNKQAARNFTDLSRMDFGKGARDGRRRSFHDILEEYHVNDDPHAHLLPIINDIRHRLGDIRKRLEAQKRGLRTPDAPTDLLAATDTVEAVATARARQRQEEGHESQSDRDERLPEPERRSQTEKALLDIGLPTDMAHTMARAMVTSGVKYRFDEADLDTTAFFSVKRSGGGALILRLNTRHPAYSNLIEVLEEGTAGAGPDELRSRRTQVPSQPGPRRPQDPADRVGQIRGRAARRPPPPPRPDHPRELGPGRLRLPPAR